MTDPSQPEPAPSIRAVPFYFPQFHAIPQNDEWWGAGFTDWVNVRKATPEFPGHHQPREPEGDRYYDMSRYETLAWQVDLARRHGIFGFCHYHYWFDGEHLLGAPTKIVLDLPELDLPFCLAWANETWTRRWSDRDQDILKRQGHEPDPRLWMQHFEYLFRAWSDDRAICIDGRPVFLIYRPHLVNETERMFDAWREEAQRRGLKGLFLIAMKTRPFEDAAVLAPYDAVVKFQPFETIYGHPELVVPQDPTLGDRVRNKLESVAARVMPGVDSGSHSRPLFVDYDLTWEHILRLECEADMRTFHSVYMEWDNSARYGRRATIFRGCTPQRFGDHIGKLAAALQTRPPEDRTVFVNAWNEWAEGTYLEPDKEHGLAYLEVLRRHSAGAREHPG